MCTAGRCLNCSCLRVELVRESSGYKTFFLLYVGQFCAPCITDSLWSIHAGEKEHTDVKHLAWLYVKNMNQLHWVGQKVSLKVWCLQQGPIKEIPYILWSGNGDLQQEPKEETSWCLIVLTECFSPQKFTRFHEAGCILASIFSKNVDVKIP